MACGWLELSCPHASNLFLVSGRASVTYSRTRNAPLILGLLLAASSIAATPSEAACTDKPAKDVDWTNCKKSNLSLVRINVDRAVMIKTDLAGTDFSEASLKGADLNKSNISNTWFVKADLGKTNLAGAFGTRPRFSEANMAGSDLSKIELSRADMVRTRLEAADLTGAQLVRSNLKEARLTGAKLIASNLSRAVLAGADLSDADLSGAYLYLTRIESTDLSGAKGLTPQQLQIACGDGTTKLPAGLAAPASWPCPALER
jgi:uncharacterized protein YjbI with pentapeptide repeats